jgi:hypothetical protein
MEQGASARKLDEELRQRGCEFDRTPGTAGVYSAIVEAETRAGAGEYPRQLRRASRELTRWMASGRPCTPDRRPGPSVAAGADLQPG